MANAAVLTQLTTPAVSLVRRRQLIRFKTEDVERLTADRAVQQLQTQSLLLLLLTLNIC